MGRHDVVAGLKVKEESITFNKEVFGNIFKRERLLSAHLKGVQCCLKDHNTSDLIMLEKNLQHEYEGVLAQEEMLWF